MIASQFISGFSKIQNISEDGIIRVQKVCENLGKNNLWKRILKNVIATTAAVAITLIPGGRSVLGRAAYLAPITTVFGHPGRRFGVMAESLILTVGGMVAGLAWSLFGIYLSSLILHSNPSAAYAIRGLFLAIALLLHGFLRSHTPRLFLFVLLLIIVSVVLLTSPAMQVTGLLATQIAYPILVATGVILLVNVSIFPEFSSAFMGQTTIETLSEIAATLRDAGGYFIREGEDDSPSSIKDKEALPDETDHEHPRETGHTPGPSAQCHEGHSTTKEEDAVDVKKGPPNPGAIVGLSTRILGMFKSKLPAGGKAPNPAKMIALKDLTAAKSKIRSKLDSCKASQRECNFELAYSVLSPLDLKPISTQAMNKIAANTIAVISACESKYALLGEDTGIDTNAQDHREQDDLENDESHEQADIDVSDTDHNISGASTPRAEQDSSDKPHITKKKGKHHGRKHEWNEKNRSELDLVKPKREIEFGDSQLLRFLMKRIAKPYGDLQTVLDRSIDILNIFVAYSYGVPHLPSGAKVPKGIIIEEVDLYIESLRLALDQFDADSSSALESAAIAQEIKDLVPDVMPREETFLVSSFLLNFRQAASHTLDMLEHSRVLVERRRERRGRRRIYAPHINWQKWLYTGGGEDERLPANGMQAARRGTADDHDDEQDTDTLSSQKSVLGAPKEGDIEQGISRNDTVDEVSQEHERAKTEKLKSMDSTAEKPALILRFRGSLADAVEWIQNSEDALYAFKLTVAVFLVTWPAFVASWNTWYSLNRGLWAALQLLLITEVAIGTSIMTFLVRAVGTTLGCIWGWAAYEAGNGNEIVAAAMICIGVFPAAYVQLGSKYPKAGIVAIVSMSVVALATELKTVPGTATENFLKRLIAFIIGGVVALIVQVVLLPVKARTRLIDSLAACLNQITEMEKCVAFGIEEEVDLDVYPPHVLKHFERASSKAKTALSAAETFLPFCKNEPRLKGSFKGLALIYGEIIFVLHQIVDRMDNMLQLRTAYGSGPLEQHNAQIFPYRRNLAAAVQIILFAVHEALITKLSLPQFLPSARLANLRLINSVRQITHRSIQDLVNHPDESDETVLAQQRLTRRKYMSWNAAAAAQSEVVEYLEELVDLTKLLVGANEFRSGMLTRPTYREYVQNIEKHERKDESDSARMPGLMKTKSRTKSQMAGDGEEQLPHSLRRIQSRKMDVQVRKRKGKGSGGGENAGQLQIIRTQ